MAIVEAKHGVVAHRFTLAADDGHQVLTDLWQPEGNADTVAMVQLSHGLGEHSSRYERFAQRCVQAGIALAVHNHRGHGESCATDKLGHFADNDGWNKVISDVGQVRNYLSQFADVPLFMMGHSMGSFIAQCSLMRDTRNAAALILSASTWSSRALLIMGRLLARSEIFRHGGDAKSEKLNDLGFGRFNQQFAPNRTTADWLSRDENEVDKYVADPLCGGPYTNRLWYDFMGGLLDVTSARSLRDIPPGLPILILGGQRDPVGGEDGLTKLALRYRSTAHTDVTLRIYEGGRHEMLNETNRDEVESDVVNWIKDHT